VISLRLNFRTGFVLDSLPGWADVIALPHEERKKALADPAVRQRLDTGAHSEAAGVMRALAVWENMTIAETFEPAHGSLKGRKLGEIAALQGKAPFDCLLDLCLAEDLKTSFMPFVPGDDEASWKMRGEVWKDPRTVVGASDAGAHLDMINTFMYSTALLSEGVRERGLITLEEAVHQLTDVPARLYGLRERGRLEPGWHGDVTVFDPDTVGHGEIYTREDLPAGAARLYSDARGVDHVVVNGRPVVRHGVLTGERPGSVLRSGRDTDTVTLPGRAQERG
jgi:N-acyl-D-aspartate/D-glutamate deacylase